MDSFSVILKDDLQVDPRAYGELLAAAQGITVVEARMAIRRGGGIFAENLPEERALELAGKLEADGIGCWCVPASSLPALKAPRRATSVETTEEGLRCALLGDPEPQLLFWDGIGVVSIGLVLVPEIQEEVAGVRKQDVATVRRVEQEQRDFVRDRLLAVLTRVDLSHEENAPAAGAHHYFFDQLRRREAMQLKAFADVISSDGLEWWRLPLEETGYTADRGVACNYLAVLPIYARRKEAHTDRSRTLLQGGNVERLAFPTMEAFHRYTRWWTYRERLRTSAPPVVAAASGNGQAPAPVFEAPIRTVTAPARPAPWWRTAALAVGLLAIALIGAGVRFEQRGAQCLLCEKLRQDKVVRIWGIPARESLGTWIPPGPKSPYDTLIARNHEHLYTGFGYVRSGLFGMAPKNGRDPNGNAAPEEVDAAECANSLFTWVALGFASSDDVKEAWPRLFEHVRKIGDPGRRREVVDMMRANPDDQSMTKLLKELSR
jgi:hypothetical protein